MSRWMGRIRDEDREVPVGVGDNVVSIIMVSLPELAEDVQADE